MNKTPNNSEFENTENLTEISSDVESTSEDTVLREATETQESAENSAEPKDDCEGFVFTHYHGTKSRNLSSYDPNRKTASKSKHKHKHRRHRFKHRPWWQKVLIILAWILGVLLGLVAILAVVFAIMVSVGNAQLTNIDNMEITPPKIENAQVSVNNSNRTISYNGITYEYNENMTSILCMGIDKDELGMVDDVVGTGGQADAIYMVALDTKTGKTTVIGISRDIFADIDVFSADGASMGMKKLPLCLAYSYGDGKHTSAQNTANAVSRLFYNLPINSYFSMELNSIIDLNDAIGGVTVTMQDDTFAASHGYSKGESWHLFGYNVVDYVQKRDKSVLESSTDRMNRQIQYLEAFGARAISMSSQDLSIPVNLFNIVQSNSATNLNASKVAALATTVVTSNRELEFSKIPGTVIQNGEYAEYVVDEKALFELMLNTYYTPVN